MTTVGLLALGVVLIITLAVWALVAASANLDDFRRDEFSEERAARLAQMQAAWYSSRHAQTDKTNRAA